jgi:hypothetical protein
VKILEKENSEKVVAKKLLLSTLNLLYWFPPPIKLTATI